MRCLYCGKEIKENAAEKMIAKMCTLKDKFMVACEESYLPEVYIEQTNLFHSSPQKNDIFCIYIICFFAASGNDMFIDTNNSINYN